MTAHCIEPTRNARMRGARILVEIAMPPARRLMSEVIA
jgi:hypothetical protein